MARRIRPGGHPLHPALAHFPLALWVAGAVTDVVGWILGQPVWWLFSFGAQAAGVGMALPAMAAGALEYASIPHDHRGQDTAIRHMVAMVSAWFLFVLSLALRGLPDPAPPPLWASAAALAGALVTLVGGWLGGQLVYRYGIGV